MVLEELIFAVSAADRDAWLSAERACWDPFLQAQPGFVHKQVLVDDTQPDEVRVLIWWDSLELWKAITPEQCAEVDAGMGDLLRPWRCNALQVMRRVAPA
jgi:uncharacterized protein (TIGR03792 family)